MRALVLALGRMRRRALASLLALSLLAAVLLNGALAGTLLFNLQQLMGELQREAGLIVFLSEEAVPGRLEELARQLGGFPGVHSVRTVPRGAALSQLKASLGEDADLLDDLGPELVPDTLEVVPGPAGARQEGLEALRQSISALPGVSSVAMAANGRDSVVRLGALLSLFRVGGGATLLIMLALVSWIVAATVGLSFASRHEEIRLLRLLGATEGFVARPFLVEGFLLALGAGLLSVIGLLGLIGALRAVLGPEAVLLGLRIDLPPLWAGGAYLGASGLLGLLGALLGMARTDRP